MTEDHCFVDATDQVVSGRESMRKAWEGYFSSFPDYRIEVDDFVQVVPTLPSSGTRVEPSAASRLNRSWLAGESQQHGRLWSEPAVWPNGESTAMWSLWRAAWAQGASAGRKILDGDSGGLEYDSLLPL